MRSSGAGDGGEQGVGAYNGDIGIVESIDTRSRSMVVAYGRPAAGLSRRESERAGTRLRHHGAQEPGQRVCGGGAACGRGAAPAVLPQTCFTPGVTRARRLCVVAGRRDTVAAMMANVRQNLRYSGLAALLAAAPGPKRPVKAGGFSAVTFRAGYGILKTGFLRPRRAFIS